MKKALSVSEGAKKASHSQISVFLTLHILCFLAMFLLGFECISFAAMLSDQSFQAFSLQEILKLSFSLDAILNTFILRPCFISLVRTVFLCMNSYDEWQSKISEGASEVE